ncbi:phage tail family protein [Lactonifactor sp. BIOML-A3]|uniref:phage tail family protein n=1 Tax=unclassified Lactonifactor TaxID=2636670 RepID=UPI0012B15CCD|nr:MULTISPECIES: phage tail family protein [unclassified Lactonifactor]MSA02905.1 phage tail family protein [Lactonifactor sp. BIOML-A5]MSA10264.1 phage tail family protein [Lactonifactor sp. BIOML-A4]MSA13552.1 phage tail family protein [Lactonifactor sp. BIOML-A3]MSA19237.1 phage tail family protein [Lactonifactor sp. BIOML-A2]MSA39106.1 phage tail family protein [Lactonifactor sp. BIOML-A1]
MYFLAIENKKGEQLPLTGTQNYDVISIDGLNPPTATINASESAAFDGSLFNGSRLGVRSLVITIRINPDIELNRINLYRYIRSKEYIKVYYKNGTRDVFIEGYVETFECDLFSDKEQAQISILCPRPYFRAMQTVITDFFNVIKMFHFPFAIEAAGIPFSELEGNLFKSIVNEGDVACGVRIELRATGEVVTPKIYNVDTRGYFIVNITMKAGDVITINTVRGEKYIEFTAGGVTTNIINKVQRGSEWFQLEPGDNVFTYEAEQYINNLSCTFILTDMYQGV